MGRVACEDNLTFVEGWHGVLAEVEYGPFADLLGQHADEIDYGRVVVGEDPLEVFARTVIGCQLLMVRPFVWICNKCGYVDEFLIGHGVVEKISTWTDMIVECLGLSLPEDLDCCFHRYHYVRMLRQFLLSEDNAQWKQVYRLSLPVLYAATWV